MNRITKEWWYGEANSAQEACPTAGWLIGNCWVRVRTPRAGWANLERSNYNAQGAKAKRASPLFL